MKTKFIGLEGFNEIESLSASKKSSKKIGNIGNAKKVIRFSKRAVSLLGKKIKLSCKKYFFTKKTVSKHQSKKSSYSLSDKRYREHRAGTDTGFDISAKGAITSVVSTNKGKYAHSEPTHKNICTVIRKKAVLATVACFVAITLSCMTVASALDFKGSAKSTSVAATADESKSRTTSNAKVDLTVSTADEATKSLASDAYVSITKGLINDSIGTNTYALYIDGSIIGVTSDATALKQALNQKLADCRNGYDDATTTEFENDVEIKEGSFDDDEVMSVDDIINAAQSKFSISLSTDIVYNKELKYDTKVKYDDSKSTSYKKVTTKGKNGEAKVTVRTTFVDGMQTNAEVTDSKTLTKPVDEVVVKGTKKTSSSASYSSESSSSSSTSSGSFGWPMPYTHNITSNYEWRWGRMHWGIDISAGGIYGQTIVASDSGTVSFAGNNGDGYGNYVIIDHGNGYQTLYGHCSSLAVSAGQSVSKGQTIAYVGSTGNSTGPHLHFEVRYGSNKLNPLQFVQ